MSGKVILTFVPAHYSFLSREVYKYNMVWDGNNFIEKWDKLTDRHSY